MYGQPQDPEYLDVQHRFAAEHDWFSVLKLDARTHFAMLEAASEVADAVEAFVSGNEVVLRVSIVGGGIGGLTAAVALVRKGIAVEVFEQAPGLGRAGASIDLGPNAIRLLDALDLGEVRRVGAPPGGSGAPALGGWLDAPPRPAWRGRRGVLRRAAARRLPA